MADPVYCKTCVHFRSTPFEARKAGCYLPKNMPGRQKDAYLDEQQIPGDHERINRKNDCPDHQAREAKRSFLSRLFSKGA
ncbi:MAG: hypothetical protein O7B99_04220 [Planctomycetota bacterium]|nr:hypothetical protein [Planctomycetota bacterium]